MAIIPNFGTVITDTSGGRALRVTLAGSGEPSGSIILGSDDGTITGNLLPFVNNVKEQILATDDRDVQIEYADFGTKNQRITKLTYTSAKFPNIAAVKDIQYTLIGTKFRRDNIIWSVQNV